MGASKRRAADRAGRPAMRSPGRPPVGRREHRQRFWVAITRGSSSEDAGVAASVSPAVGTRRFREGGGMPTVSRAPLSWRSLSFAEREELAILRPGRNRGVQVAVCILRRLRSHDAAQSFHNGRPWRRAGAPPLHATRGSLQILVVADVQQEAVQEPH